MSEDYGFADPRGVYGRAATMAENVAFAICSCRPCICRNKAGFTGMPCLDHARKGIEAVRRGLKESEFKRGPSGGHGERPEPSIDEMFDEALK